MDQLVNGAQSDIRQVLNMLSTWKLSSSTMDFDEGKNLYVLFWCGWYHTLILMSNTGRN